jgi:cation:H+ antiporter
VALGNVIGSNIYNALFILGVTSLCMPIQIPAGMWIDMLIMTGVTALMIGIALGYKKFTRATGVIFLISYAVYIVYLAQMGQIS